MSKHTSRVAMILMVLLVFLSACGGGGGGGDGTPSPTNTVVTAGLSGPSVVIGSVDMEITLPADFTLAVDNQGTPTALQLAAGLNGITLASNYVHPSLKLSLMKADGFFADDLITFSRALAAGDTIPPISAFTVTFQAYDLNGTAFANGSFTTTLQVVGQ